MTEEPEERSRWDGWLSPKQWIPLTGVLVIAVIGLAVFLFLGINDSDATSAPRCAPGDTACAARQPTHQHADFALFIRGQQFDFSQPQFISHEDADEEDETADMHEPRFTVVHVHRELTTWDEFLTSLHFKLTDPSYLGVDSARTCMTLPSAEKLCGDATNSWKFYVNGVKVDGVANITIHDLDRVLMSYGSESEPQVLAQVAEVTDQACIPSEKCKPRIPANEPAEPCTVSNTSCVKPGG